MKKRLNIIGGGPSAFALASELDPEKFEVIIHEKNPAMGRKFLVAGQGGFNLTHSEDPEQFIKRYTPHKFLEKAFFSFSNRDFVNWLQARGIETRVGTSGRVFPIKGIKPIHVLDTLLNYLKNRGVTLRQSREWMGFTDAGDLVFKTKNEVEIEKSDITVFCLGGASWPQTGTKGDWTKHFVEKGIKLNPFQASNCAYKIQWPKALIAKIEGNPLKNCVITCKNASQAGEVVLTQFGIEGSGIYPLSASIRKALENNKETTIKIDFKPSISSEKLLEKLKSKKSKITYSKHIQSTLNLSDTQMHLLKHDLSKEDFLNESRLVFFVKHFPLKISGVGPIEKAISTVGGIDLNELTGSFELKKLKNTYALGEMLDYDAPTGGYLLQSCFSMGHFLAQHLNSCP